ncbi:MAG: hypothetical protein KKB30_06715 [Proteobacteria bacterium]|nr:hypothetical protein [Pseudomonadota bacterium]MBU1715409.1 hypothetical protein [Pseudomonadota bacterium]
MKQRIYRFGILLLICFVMIMGSGCVTVPQQEFKAYSEAFSESKKMTEQLLIEYDQAKKNEAERQTGKKNVESEQPYPKAVDLKRMYPGFMLMDPVSKRHEALQVVTGFNEIIISLAEGKNPEEVKSTTDSFIENFNKFSELIGDDFEIPYAGQISRLVSDVITKFEEAKNRKQFIAALTKAEPFIQSILLLFLQDAEDLYDIKVKQSDRLWSGHQDKVAILVRQMRNVANEHKAPTNQKDQKKLNEIEGKVKNLLDRVGLKDNNEKLQTKVGDSAFNQIALSQLQQTLDQTNSVAYEYEKVIKTHNAFHEVIVSYGELISKTSTSLTIVRLAFDKPIDIRQQASELVSLAFTVKRNWEALDKARRSTIDN